MADVRRMTIPLRGAWKVPRTKRANRAMEEVKRHVVRHMKVTNEETIWIDETVNHKIWERGMQKPPRRINVVVTREEGFPIEVKIDDENEGNTNFIFSDTRDSRARASSSKLLLKSQSNFLPDNK